MVLLPGLRLPYCWTCSRLSSRCDTTGSSMRPSGLDFRCGSSSCRSSSAARRAGLFLARRCLTRSASNRPSAW
eukprot:4583185-Pyramimonas_sp.AAC.1